MVYPSIIVGEDAFAGWGPNRIKSEKERIKNYSEVLDFAYSKGIRGFAMSFVPSLITILEEFKQKYSDIVCIANPHKGFNYYYKETLLWETELRKRALATEKSCIISSNSIPRDEWYKSSSLDDAFSNRDLDSIKFKSDDFSSILKSLHFCDYCLVGNFNHGFLYHTNMINIVQEQINLVLKRGMIPIGICEGSSAVFSKIQQLKLDYIWVWYNSRVPKDEQQELQSAFKSYNGKITAYKVLSGLGDVIDSIQFIKNAENLGSIVIGCETKDELAEVLLTLQNS